MDEMFQQEAQAARAIGLPAGESVSVDVANDAWQGCGVDGFWIKPLLQDEQAGLRTWLMKVDAGAFSDLHAHDEIEQVYVLEGSFYDQHKTYRAGEYILRAPGALHSAGSESGAVVLLFYSPTPGKAD